MNQSKGLTYLKYFVLVFLATAALISTGRGIYNATNVSMDFQWGGSVILLEGDNPYKVYLEGRQDIYTKEMSPPNYAHSLYLALTPFGLMSWDTAKISWAVFNVFIGILVVLIVVRSFNLTIEQSLFVAFIFLAGSPFRIGIGNGQQGLIMLFAFSALLTSSSYWSSLAAGCGYFKYSFAPPFASYLLFKRGVWHFLTSLLPGVAGFIVFWAITGGPLVETLIHPLLVSSQSVASGSADIMTITESVTQEGSIPFLIGYYFIPISISLLGGYISFKFTDNKNVSFAFLCVISLLSFKHLSYDFVFLLPVLCLAIKNIYKYTSVYILSVVLFVYFGWKVVYELTSRFDSLSSLAVLKSPYLNLFLLLSIAVAIPYMASSTEPSEEPLSAER